MNHRIISACLLLLAALAAPAEEPSLSLEANRNELYFGESFILRATVSGSRRDVELDMSGIRNCNVEFLGSRDMSQYSMTIINGRVAKEEAASRVLSYRLTPLSAGTIQAGPVSLSVEGKIVAARGPLVTVKDIDKQDMVKISIHASRDTALVDEPFDITLAILIRALQGKYASVQPLFPDDPPNVDIPYLAEIPGLEGPDINQILNERAVARRDQSGIGINNIAHRIDPFDFGSLSSLRGFFDEPRRVKFSFKSSMTEEDGKSYIKYTLTLSFTPVQEGDYVFGPAIFKGSIPAEVDELGRAKGAEIFAVGHACTVRVVPPPEEGRPFSFSGAIGADLNASAELDAHECSVGDPLRLTLTLDGNVRLANMLPPRLSLQTNLAERFTIYDNTVETLRQQDRVQYVYTLRPVVPGPQELPPVEVSYYSTGERAYRTVMTEAVPLQIHKATEITASKIIGRPDQPAPMEEKPKPVPAQIRTDISGSVPDSLTGNPLAFGLLAAAGPLFYALAALGQFVAVNKEKWGKKSLRKKAAARALAGLKLARSLSRSDPRRARAEICAILRRYLADRLQQPSAALTPRDVCGKLIDSGICMENAETFSLIFEQVFNSGFCSSAKETDTDSLCEKLQSLVSRMEKESSARTRAPATSSNNKQRQPE